MPLATISNNVESYWDNESINYEIMSLDILDDLELFISPMSLAVLIDTGW
jgi:hypothetical protein